MIGEKPVIFYEGSYTQSSIDNFIKENKARSVRDIFADQLKELFEINNPQLRQDPNFLNYSSEFISKTNLSKKTGDWVYFPWSGTMVHMLSKIDYIKLRTNRNQNLITAQEQQILLESKVAIAGLSVGSHIAVNLAHNGIGQNLCLAEFDSLETSNLNRIRAGVDKIGLSKLSIASQELYEIDPYVSLECISEGLTEDSLQTFVLKEPRPNIIFEIIDGFEMKIKMRLLAREAGIPVIMIANLGDSVLLDIERFDLDKKLPLFNGVIGDTPEVILSNPDLTEEDKHRYAVQLVGKENVPIKALRSVMEINKTLVGRPQLMSTVAVSAGLATYFGRRIILGEKFAGGRKIFRFNELSEM